MAKRTKKTEAITDEKSTIVTPKKLPVPKTLLTKIILTEKQKELEQLIDKNKITIVDGPSGTSKTFLACYYAIKALRDGKYDKVIITKPAEESGEKLGFLPGTVEEKIGPYYNSFYSTFAKLIPEKILKTLEEKECIKATPLAYMRGASYEKCLDGDTIIVTNMGNKKLVDVMEYQIMNPDEKLFVLSHNIKKNTDEYKELTGIQRHKSDKKVMKITFENNEEMIMTQDHQFYDDQSNLINAEDITKNTNLFVRTLDI